MKWRRLGEGSYNIAYRSSDGKSVFKESMDGSPSDLPERSVRLWNLINPRIHPPARIAREQITYLNRKGKLVTKWVKGWICPFISGRQATDEEIRMALIDTFNRTGRIVADATAPNNFLTMSNGETVCIDVGHALEMESRETASLLGVRKPSFTSLDTYAEEYDIKERKQWFKEHSSFSPKAVKTVEALLFIKKYRADIKNVNFLKKSPKTVTLLANAYIKGTQALVDQALALLAEKRSPDLENTKQRCRDIFLEYIERVGTIDAHEQFTPHPTRQDYDMDYIERTMTLMRRINTAKTCDECHAIVEEYLADSSLLDTSEIIEDIAPPADDAWIETLETMIDEVQELTLLRDVQDRCQIILNGYVSSFIVPERDDPAIQPTTHYKSQMAQSRVKDQIDQLFLVLNNATTFAEMLSSLDDFSQKLPPISSQKQPENHVITDAEALLGSVNYCRIIVQSAMRAEHINPELKSGI